MLFPESSYKEALEKMGMPTLYEKRDIMMNIIPIYKREQ